MEKSSNLLFTLGDLKKRLNPSNPPRKKAHRKRTHRRLVSWHPGHKYILIKRATHCFESLAHIESVYQQNALTCQHLTIFRHIDPHIDRTDRLEPRFMAVFTLLNDANLHYIPIQLHYKQCYRNSDRTDKSHMYRILPNGTPYWCCIYIERLKSEHLSKQKSKDRSKRGSCQSLPLTHAL